MGAAAGVAVAVMSRATQLVHELLFAIPEGQHLSASPGLAPWRVLSVPVLGGLLLGLIKWLSGRYRSRAGDRPDRGQRALRRPHVAPRQPGRRARDAGSNGAGASIGLEAGYTQVGSGFSSRLGEILRLRRNDLRILVGCGAAGAIGAAFDAPLTGAFYAFELVLGGYTASALAPVVASALAGTALAKVLAAHATSIEIATSTVPTWRDQLLFLALGATAALAGIALMLGVTWTERAFRGTRIPRGLRPAVGASRSWAASPSLHPEVLSSGHGALYGLLESRSRSARSPHPRAQDRWPRRSRSAPASAAACSSPRCSWAACSAAFFAGTVDALSPALHLDQHAYAIIGMGSMAVTVVGGPLTMVFLALETTGDFALAPGPDRVRSSSPR